MIVYDAYKFVREGNSEMAALAIGRSVRSGWTSGLAFLFAFLFVGLWAWAWINNDNIVAWSLSHGLVGEAATRTLPSAVKVASVAGGILGLIAAGLALRPVRLAVSMVLGYMGLGISHRVSTPMAPHFRHRSVGESGAETRVARRHRHPRLRRARRGCRLESHWPRAWVRLALRRHRRWGRSPGAEVHVARRDRCGPRHRIGALLPFGRHGRCPLPAVAWSPALPLVWRRHRPRLHGDGHRRRRSGRGRSAALQPARRHHRRPGHWHPAGTRVGRHRDRPWLYLARWCDSDRVRGGRGLESIRLRQPGRDCDGSRNSTGTGYRIARWCDSDRVRGGRDLESFRLRQTWPGLRWVA